MQELWRTLGKDRRMKKNKSKDIKRKVITIIVWTMLIGGILGVGYVIGQQVLIYEFRNVGIDNLCKLMI